MRVLPGTSVWVDYLRGGASRPAGELDGLLEDGSVLICGPVMAELLAGAPPDRRDALWLALRSLPWAELDHAGWREVGELANVLRRVGISLPLTGLVIAVACVRSEAMLWTRDRDFERIRDGLPALELRLGRVGHSSGVVRPY